MTKEWEKDAERLLGIPLHPLGEIDFFSFVNIRTHSDATPKAEAQHRLIGIQIQLTFSIVFGILSVYNLRRLIQQIVTHSYGFLDLFYFIPSSLGLVYAMIVMIASLTSHMNCRIIVWYAMTAISISMFCNSIIILYKTYLVLLSQRWVAICGTICILPQLFFSLIACKYSRITLEEYYGCFYNYDDLVSLCWFGIMIPSNILFSGIFSVVTYKHYKRYGSDAWKRLARDNIQIMSLVVLCNIICCIIAISKIGNHFSGKFYVVDWYTTSTILVKYVTKRRATNIYSNSAKNGPNDIYSMDVDVNNTKTNYSSRFAITTNYI
ncbi:hypothetical protein BDF19DRAFT_432216 [Syncephalis fuscata]|nr:hypothetical protein BDF19DRAFT_432216 [Syncephalis fuscata]